MDGASKKMRAAVIANHMNSIFKSLKRWNKKRLQKRRGKKLAPSYDVWQAQKETIPNPVVCTKKKLLILQVVSEAFLPNFGMKFDSNQICAGWEEVDFLNVVVNDGNFFCLVDGVQEILNWDLIRKKFEWCFWLSPGCVPSNYSIAWLAGEVLAAKGDFVYYGDSDKIDANGRRFDPYFKPGPGLFFHLASGYMGDAIFVKTDVLAEFLPLRGADAISCAYDFILRVFERFGSACFKRIPKVLSHRLGVSEVVNRACLESCERVIAGMGANGSCALDEENNRISFVVDYPRSPPFVSIIIPTKDRSSLLRVCIDSIYAHTPQAGFEILVVDNGSVEGESRKYFDELESRQAARIISVPGEFNYSLLNNVAAKEARGDLLLLLNNDIEIISDEWLERLVFLAKLPSVACVGTRLLYPDGRVQHGGLVLGVGGVAAHVLKGRQADDGSYRNWLTSTHEVSAVTGACLMIRKALYEELGGLDGVNLKVAFNDVDLCLKARMKGFVNIYAGEVALIHHESVSRSSDMVGDNKIRWKKESEYMSKRWGAVLKNDDYLNPNFSIYSDQFELAIR